MHYVLLRYASMFCYFPFKSTGKLQINFNEMHFNCIRVLSIRLLQEYAAKLITIISYIFNYLIISKENILSLKLSPKGREIS